MKNSEVAERFVKSAAGEAGHFKTDGIKVWSYNMLIAERFGNGRVWILDRDESPSVTTTRHRNLVAAACERAGIKRA